MRLDRYLKLSKAVKRRTVACEMIEVGAVKLNGSRIKPAAGVKLGDKIEIAFPSRLLSIEVTECDETALKRGAQGFKVLN